MTWVVSKWLFTLAVIAYRKYWKSEHKVEAHNHADNE